MNMPYRMTDARGMLVSLLGVSSRDAQDELGPSPQNFSKMGWLCSKFSDVTDADSKRRIQCDARAYLLYLVSY